MLGAYRLWWLVVRDDLDEARSIGCLSREPATCGRRYRSAVRSYFVFIVAVDSVVVQLGLGLGLGLGLVL